jgi:hypothetical protein
MHASLKRECHFNSENAHYVSSKLTKLRSAPSSNQTKWRNNLPTVRLKRGDLGTAGTQRGGGSWTLGHIIKYLKNKHKEIISCAKGGRVKT